jgi:hypothetical protein
MIPIMNWTDGYHTIVGGDGRIQWEALIAGGATAWVTSRTVAWKTVISDDVKVRVVDSTEDYRWMVLPIRAAGTEG